jgi:hypothetical protein
VLAVVVALGSALALAGDLMRFSYNLPGDAKPIIVHADEMASWVAGSERIILARGRVLIEHGGMQVRAEQAAAWIDPQQYRRTGILHFELYAEGNVMLENSAETRSAPSAFMDISTRGEVKLKAYNGKVVQNPQPDDPVLKRAEATRAQQNPAAASAIQKASYQQPAPSGTSAPIYQTPAPQPQTTSPIAPGPPSPGGFGPPVQQGLPPQFPPGPSGAVPPGQQAPPPQFPVDPSGAMPRGQQTLPPQYPMNPSAAQPLPTPAPAQQNAPAVPQGPMVPPTRPSAIPFPPQAGGIAPFGVPGTAPQRYSIQPRTSAGFEPQSFVLPNGEYVTVLTGGVILVAHIGPNDLLDIEADRLVVWSKENPQQMLSGMRSPEGRTGRELEFYMAGHVEVRQRNGPQEHLLRANEVYYDVGRQVAVAMQANIEFRQKGIPDPIHLKAEELLQLSPAKFQAMRAEIFSSRLPSDPGLKIYVADTTVEEKKVPKRSIFGPVFNSKTGEQELQDQRLFQSRNIFLELQDIPVLYFPYLQGDANDPLGPLQSVNFGYNRIFGARFETTWNVYDLFGLDPLPGTKWRLDVDYLSKRGPALGTNFDYVEKGFFGLPSEVTGTVKAYGIVDNGVDMLGGGRGPEDNHPEERGRLLWRQNVLELPAGFTLQTQVAPLSDKNFLEQYYKYEFDSDINQETFLYLKQQQDNWAWTILTEQRIRNWVTETNWLPRADGYLLGQSFFDIFTYNAHASAAYAQLRPTNVPPPPVEITDKATDTGRFDLWQELSAPFSLGAFRVVPYGVLDLTYYTEDLDGNARGRLYEGGGLRASIPFTRLYPDVQSDLLNLNGINHKIVLSGNYFIAHSDTSHELLPQLDRLNDDATDQALRDIKPIEPLINPAHGLALATLPLYDPQIYAIRRLVDNRIDTLDSIEVLELDIRQRWQTKRGYPGQQHIVDWMTLDLSGSFFPNSNRDNFGEDFAFLQYDWTWNIGDRTALVSSGWVDPETNGPRVFTIGTYLNRPDRTSLYFGYRQIDPLESRAFSASVSYVFSPKYSMSAGASYDVGTKVTGGSFIFTRTGTDLVVNLGLTYNSTLSSFGFTFEILPIAAAQSPSHVAGGGLGLGANSPLARN